MDPQLEGSLGTGRGDPGLGLSLFSPPMSALKFQLCGVLADDITHHTPRVCCIEVPAPAVGGQCLGGKGFGASGAALSLGFVEAPWGMARLSQASPLCPTPMQSPRSTAGAKGVPCCPPYPRASPELELSAHPRPGFNYSVVFLWYPSLSLTLLLHRTLPQRNIWGGIPGHTGGQ